MPNVSIIMLSYNHEKYVSEAIQSIINQTFQNFEIIIVDNGSTDLTYQKIKKFKDLRIKAFRLVKNRSRDAMKICLKESRGEYIAIFCSDDVLLPNKLEKQIEFLNLHSSIGAIFSRVQLINEQGENFNNDTHHYSNIFNQTNKSRFQWLNYFFYKGNCLCYSSVMLRKSLFNDIKFDDRLAQLPDFDLWIKLVFKYEIHLLQEKLIKFRIRGGNQNASAQTPETTVRSMFEFGHVLKNFLKIKDVDEFLKIFPEAKKYNDITDDELIPFYVARQALEVEHIFHQKFGLDVSFELLQNKKIAKKLRDKCNFDYSDFIKLTGKHDLYHVNHIEYQDSVIAKLKQENEELKKPKRQLKELVNHLKNYF